MKTPGLYVARQFFSQTLIIASVLAPLTLYGADTTTEAAHSLSYYDRWPAINRDTTPDDTIEIAVADILAQMTLEEKIGQMIQPNLSQVTPEEAKQYKLGSLLNGGGTWPGNNKRATAADWVATADSYWEALDEAYADRGFRIPFMWGTDAVHGHNNVFGATIFPHNIGLGAANDPDLVYRIGEATAKEVAATGLDWTFAPTLAVPRNDRWGRTYEGYSEDPAITYRYAGKIVQGLQEGSSGLHTDTQVLATLKHWIGDGGTLKGIDQGQNHYTEEQLINLHAPGYFSALKAGAQVVMTSFNSWHQDTNYGPPADDGSSYNKKLHGSYYLITEVLKGKLGFDGLVVTDWNG
ncbi:MAG: glycoside hydrolase family 3 protein, partial [Thiolinea sp.]